MLEDVFPDKWYPDQSYRWIKHNDILIRFFQESNPKPLCAVIFRVWKRENTFIKFYIHFLGGVELFCENGKHIYSYEYGYRKTASEVKSIEKKDRRWFIKRFVEGSTNIEPEIRDFVMSELPYFSPPSIISRSVIMPFVEFLNRIKRRPRTATKPTKPPKPEVLEELPGVDE